jgi:putative ABC transport system permease protein
MLLALLGGLPGVALAAVFAAALETSVGNFIPGFAVTPGIALTAILLMLAFGLATGLVPAVAAMRLKIATALGRS